MKDTVIIGGGVSALTAAIYLARFERKIVLACDSFGGQTAIAGSIENFPGFKSIDGSELISELIEQIKQFNNIEIKEGSAAKKIEDISGGYKVILESKEEIEGKAVIIATGRRHKKLGLVNESKLVGKGISYCAVCDGPFAREKDVVIVGGGYAAGEAALIVEKVAKSISIISLTPELTCEAITSKKISQNEKIKIFFNSEVSEIKETENSFVEGVRVKNNKTGEVSTIDAQMIFIEIGQIPNSEPFKDMVELTKNKEIKIDKVNTKTSRKGIYASGDVTDVPFKQIVVAASEGAKSAIEVNGFLETILTEKQN